MSEVIETLDDTGFTFEEVGLQARRITANFGDGYTAGARIGLADGLRGWKVRIDLLPDFDLQPGASFEAYIETRARYLWNFWKRHKLERNSEIFIMRDPFPADPTRKRDRVFARFIGEDLSLPMTTEYLFSAGLTLRQARIPGYPDANDYNPSTI